MVILASITPCAEKTAKEVNICSDSGNVFVETVYTDSTTDIDNTGGIALENYKPNWRRHYTPWPHKFVRAIDFARTLKCLRKRKSGN